MSHYVPLSAPTDQVKEADNTSETKAQTS